MYSKLSSFSLNSQGKKKKNTKEIKTKKRIIDNHKSNSLASIVYLGKPLSRITKTRKTNSNININFSGKSEKSKNITKNIQEKMKEHKNSELINDVNNNKNNKKHYDDDDDDDDDSNSSDVYNDDNSNNDNKHKNREDDASNNVEKDQKNNRKLKSEDIINVMNDEKDKTSNRKLKSDVKINVMNDEKDKINNRKLKSENKINEVNDEKDKINNRKLKSENKINEMNDEKETNIFKDHDFMYILKNKKEYTVEEILKLQNIYEDENKGEYFRVYPCDDREKMRKYRSFTMLTSKKLNTNTLATKIRLEYLRKKKEKEEAEERRRLLWKKKVKQGYFIGRYKIHNKDEKNIYEKFKGALYKANNNRIRRNKMHKSAESVSSSLSYASIANIKNISFDLNNSSSEILDDDSNTFTIPKRNLNTISLLSHQTMNKSGKENLLDDTINLFKVNYPYNISDSSFNTKSVTNNNISDQNDLFINGKQINYEIDEDDNIYFKYLFLNKNNSKDDINTLRCQSAPTFQK